MKKSMDIDLTDLSDIMEGFVKKLDKYTQTDLIDLAARLKPVAKHCKTIDDFTKTFVKEKKKGKAGEVLGDSFKATLSLIPTTRLNQGELKKAEPDIYEKYSEENSEERVTFSLR